MCLSVQAQPAYHRLFKAMQEWIVTPWSSANAAAEAPSHPHAVEATPAQLPDTHVDTQTNSRTTNHCTDTGLPSAQATPFNELTESDTELLAACELYDALTRSTTTWLPDSNHLELPLDELSCNDYAPIPTSQEYKEASTLSVEGWLTKTTNEYIDSYPATLPFEDAHEPATITQYVKDIASHSALTTTEPSNMWLYFATEWLPQHPSYTSFDFEHANTTHTFGTRNTAHPWRGKKQQHWMSTSATMIDIHSSRDIVKPWASVRSSRPSSLQRAQAASPQQHRKHSKLKHCPQLSAAHYTLRAPY